MDDSSAEDTIADTNQNDDDAVAQAEQAETHYVCSAGPAAGQGCQTSSDCPLYCNGGPSYLQGCSTNADCALACGDGPDVGKACAVNTDCAKWCVGNLSTLHIGCTSSAQCGPGGSCIQPTCRGFACTRPGCSNPHA
ncbi:Hypothetical protein A7982_00880 [Minicystis rosea]|nr:Hypothetical protein A7982_00880 [Minicystis rosea]